MWRQLVAMSLVASALVLPARAEAQASCTFALGFATLRDLVGPQIIGTCLENQRYAANGNAEQTTSGGLLVWRKADNWTAFTNGYETWVNGPNGVQVRLNTEQFPWEADAASAAPMTNQLAIPVPAASETAPLNRSAAAERVVVTLLMYSTLVLAGPTHLSETAYSKTPEVRGRLLSELWDYGSLPAGTRLSYSGMQNAITISREVPATEPNLVVTLLAHGLQLAVDRAEQGVPLGPEACTARKVRAYQTQAAVWRVSRSSASAAERRSALYQEFDDVALFVASFPRRLADEYASAYRYACD